MAEKISTLIISVDLDCQLCEKKIRKTLRKFPEIQKQTFDIKQNTVTVSGHFDPEKLSKCIRCRGGKSIKDIHILKDPPPPKPKPDPPKPKPVDPPPKPKPVDPPPKPKPVDPPPKQPDPPKPDPPKPDPPKPSPPKPDPPKPDPPKPTPPKPDPPKPSPPKPDPGPPLAVPPPYICYPWPWYEGYEGGPCSSGWPYYPVHPRPPVPAPSGTCCPQCYHGHGGGPCTTGYGRHSSCGFFSEEDQACRVM